MATLLGEIARPTSAGTVPATPRLRPDRLLPWGDGLAGAVAGGVGLGQTPLGPWPVAAVAIAVGWTLLLAWFRAYDRVSMALPAVRHAVPQAGLALVGLPLLPAALLGARVNAPVLLGMAAWCAASAVLLRLPARRHPARLVVAGHHDGVRRTMHALERDPRVQVVGACVAGARGDRGLPVPTDVGFERLPELARRLDADGVVVLPCRHLDAPRLRRLGWTLEQEGVHLLLSPGLVDVTRGRGHLREYGDLGLLHVRHPDLVGPRRVVKEVGERALAATALLVASPLLVCLALLVRLDTPGPAFFTQERVGRHGRVFRMIKLRSMVPDASHRLAMLLEDNEADGELFKIRADPRVTRLGRWLRRTSLDELPQLVNVVLGDMALVGPRPPLPHEVAGYDGDARRRLVVKPGLTGLWQVSGRSDLSWSDTVRLDLRYVDNWSLGLDAAILARTLRAVATGRGAY
ncbi:sugar transferase [Nocardioides marinus]|uniref:Exopolysaccharide biosynthesis polyprenyl glycosylphosphotransferase n=1 Tax=Nocardioides marinus TaxID=374514 RepID=A0A7Z0C4G8_9ACTN|nr:exopolysaccharide biosynthesis polyprenyl glycosylphosphotransferase [Nocardioides marinus]